MQELSAFGIVPRRGGKCVGLRTRKESNVLMFASLLRGHSIEISMLAAVVRRVANTRSDITPDRAYPRLAIFGRSLVNPTAPLAPTTRNVSVSFLQ